MTLAHKSATILSMGKVSYVICPSAPRDYSRSNTTRKQGSEREESWCGHLERESPTAVFVKKGHQTKIGDKNCVRESVSIRRACAYISRRFNCVSPGADSFETQSAFRLVWGQRRDILSWSMTYPKRGKFPKYPKTMMYLWVHCLFQAWNASPLFGGVRVLPEIPFLVNNNRVRYKNYSCNP
ncbi:hypothetical protein TNCV_111221 [Trichonephila clavipes]|nr:hypothetical protein TNCV_111221 [Trichonephila clavipes]